MKPIALTVFSDGNGQDSTYIKHKIATDQAFRDQHVIGDLLIAGSDTGCEHPHTYENERIVNDFMRAKGIDSNFITNDMGFHGLTWQSLDDQFNRNESVGSVAFRQTCTHKLKVQVVDRFVEKWIADKYYGGVLKSKKRTYLDFYRDYGSIRLILGFAAKEEGRTQDAEVHDPVWKKKVVIRHHPLIIDGIDRQMTINYNEANWKHKVFPSNCMKCFYMLPQELLWLFRFYPDVYYDWLRQERNKKAKHATKEVNHGVFGKISLEQMLEKAIAQFGHMTDDELIEFKYSHGHCIKTKY